MHHTTELLIFGVWDASLGSFIALGELKRRAPPPPTHTQRERRVQAHVYLCAHARMHTTHICVCMHNHILHSLSLHARPLFPGRSERQQLELIFKVVGTPLLQDWPQCNIQWRSFGCYPATPFDRIIPHATYEALDLIAVRQHVLGEYREIVALHTTIGPVHDQAFFIFVETVEIQRQ